MAGFEAPIDADYRIFTREFDRVVDAADLDSVLGPLSAAHAAALHDAWQAFELALAGWKTRAHLRALAASEAVRRRTTDAERANTVVSILVDQSGSMRGQSMLLAAAAADVAQNFLSHLGCRVEVLGFTTVSWRGGQARRRWLWHLRPKNPGRLCETLHIVYRTAEDPRMSAGQWAFRSMLRPDLPKENVDGEALAWARERLRARPEGRKILLLVCDSASADEATCQANDADYLARHLRAVIRSIEQQRDVELAALGIGCDVGDDYRRSSRIRTADELGTGLVGLLEQVLCTPSSRGRTDG